MRLKPLCLAFILGLYSAGTAYAGPQDDMNFFFNNMSCAGDTTSAKAWQGQATRYVSGGSLYTRTGDKNIQLVSISLPSINAGCNGVDVHLGASSSINSDQIMAFVKQTMANAVGYFFGLALETTVSELKAAKDFLQKMAADTSRFNMSSYQTTRAMVDSVASLWGESQQNVCQSVGGQKSVFSDQVASRQRCTSSGRYGSVADKATSAGKDQILKDINLIRDALDNSSLSSNAELHQFTMSISDSIILGNNGELWVLPSMALNRSLLVTVIGGGTAKVYVCDNQNECLSPTLDNVIISADKSLIKMVQDMLTGIENKAITDTSLMGKEKQFISSTSIPILSWAVDQSSLSVSQFLFTQLTDHIAVDVYLQYLETVMEVVNGSSATKDYPDADTEELKDGPSDAKQVLNLLRMEVQIREDALVSAQQQIRFTCQQVSSEMNDCVLGNYQFGRVN